MVARPINPVPRRHRVLHYSSIVNDGISLGMLFSPPKQSCRSKCTQLLIQRPRNSIQSHSLFQDTQLGEEFGSSLPPLHGPLGKNGFNNSMASGDDASRSLIASAIGPARACLFTVSIASCACSSRNSSSPLAGEVPPQAAVGGFTRAKGLTAFGVRGPGVRKASPLREPEFSIPLAPTLCVGAASRTLRVATAAPRRRSPSPAVSPPAAGGPGVRKASPLSELDVSIPLAPTLCVGAVSPTLRVATPAPRRRPQSLAVSPPTSGGRAVRKASPHSASPTASPPSKSPSIPPLSSPESTPQFVVIPICVM